MPTTTAGVVERRQTIAGVEYINVGASDVDEKTDDASTFQLIGHGLDPRLARRRPLHTAGVVVVGSIRRSAKAGQVERRLPGVVRHVRRCRTLEKGLDDLTATVGAGNVKSCVTSCRVTLE